MWNAPQARATSPSSTSAARQSTVRAIDAPYSFARPGTPARSGSSYWPRSAVYAHGHGAVLPPSRPRPPRCPGHRRTRYRPSRRLGQRLQELWTRGGSLSVRVRAAPLAAEVIQMSRRWSGSPDQAPGGEGGQPAPDLRPGQAVPGDDQDGVVTGDGADRRRTAPPGRWPRPETAPPPAGCAARPGFPKPSWESSSSLQQPAQPGRAALHRAAGRRPPGMTVDGRSAVDSAQLDRARVPPDPGTGWPG